MSKHHVCARQEAKKRADIRPPGTGITDPFESQCGCWEPNPAELSLPQVLKMCSVFKSLKKELVV